MLNFETYVEETSLWQMYNDLDAAGMREHVGCDLDELGELAYQAYLRCLELGVRMERPINTRIDGLYVNRKVIHVTDEGDFEIGQQVIHLKKGIYFLCARCLNGVQRMVVHGVVQKYRHADSCSEQDF